MTSSPCFTERSFDQYRIAHKPSFVKKGKQQWCDRPASFFLRAGANDKRPVQVPTVSFHLLPSILLITPQYSREKKQPEPIPNREQARISEVGSACLKTARRPCPPAESIEAQHHCPFHAEPRCGGVLCAKSGEKTIKERQLPKTQGCCIITP